MDWTLVQISTPSCGPCNSAKKAFEQGFFLPYKYIDATKQDIEKYKAVETVRRVPHFFLERGDDVISLHVGYPQKENIEKLARQAIESKD